MLTTLLASLALNLSPVSNDGKLTEQSVVYTDATICLEQSDFEEIILDIEKGGDGKAVYNTKPWRDSITEGVLLQLLRRVDTYEFKGVTYWLLEAKMFNTDVKLYVGLPAHLFIDSKNII